MPLTGPADLLLLMLTDALPFLVVASLLTSLARQPFTPLDFSDTPHSDLIEKQHQKIYPCLESAESYILQ